MTTRLTGVQIQHLQDRFAVVVAEAQGNCEVSLRRRDDKPLRVETVEKMVGISGSGWRQVRNWVEADI